MPIVQSGDKQNNIQIKATLSVLMLTSFPFIRTHRDQHLKLNRLSVVVVKIVLAFCRFRT